MWCDVVGQVSHVPPRELKPVENLINHFYKWPSKDMFSPNSIALEFQIFTLELIFFLSVHVVLKSQSWNVVNLGLKMK